VPLDVGAAVRPEPGDEDHRLAALHLLVVVGVEVEPEALAVGVAARALCIEVEVRPVEGPGEPLQVAPGRGDRRVLVGDSVGAVLGGVGQDLRPVRHVAVHRDRLQDHGVRLLRKEKHDEDESRPPHEPESRPGLGRGNRLQEL
jgi:hypothetical protein